MERDKRKSCKLSDFLKLTEGLDFSGRWKAFAEDSWCCSCSKVWKYDVTEMFWWVISDGSQKKQKCTGPAQIMLSGCTMPIRRHRIIHGFHQMMMMMLNVDIVGKHKDSHHLEIRKTDKRWLRKRRKLVVVKNPGFKILKALKNFTNIISVIEYWFIDNVYPADQQQHSLYTP